MLVPPLRFYPGLRGRVPAAYGAAAFLIALAAVAGWSTAAVLDHAALMFFLIAVACVAAVAGQGPGLAAAASALVVSGVLWPPGSSADIAALAIFAAVAAAICVIIETTVEQAARGAREGASDLLVGEAQHRLRNHLQFVIGLITMQARATRDRQVANSLHDAARRLGLVAEIHTRLAQSAVAQADPAGYLAQLCRDLPRALGSDRVVVTCEVADVRLAPRELLRVALIVNELVTNALKHAFSPDQRGHVRITLRRGDRGVCELTVNDDGRGLPPGFAAGRDGHFGWQVIQAMIADLDGALTIESGPGSRFCIVFPGAPSASGGLPDAKAAAADGLAA